MDDYLTKPLDRSRLAEALARWLPAEIGAAAGDAGGGGEIGRAAGAPTAGGAQTAPRPQTAGAGQAAAPPVSTPIELGQLRSIVGDDAAAIRRYLTLFDTTSRGLLDRIAGAIERRDSVDLSRAAHTLKGTAGNVGAAEVSGLARELEAAAGRADWASCGGFGAELRVALDRAAAFARTVAG